MDLNNKIVINFLNENNALSLSALEKEAGLSSGLLSKVLKEERNLNQAHLDKLKPVLEKYGLKNKGIAKKAKIIAMVNHKGGVGKTTSTVNLGKALSMQGFKVLMVDLDPQGNLSQCYGIEEPQEQLYDALIHNRELPFEEVAENLFLSPSDVDLSQADLELHQRPDGYIRLKKVLLPQQEEFDYILLDCPPSLGILTSNALIASDSFILILQPETLAIKGLNTILRTVDQIKDGLNENLTVEGILFTLVDKRTINHQTIMNYVHENFPYFKIFNSIIRSNMALSEASMISQTIFDYAPRSNGAKDYMAVTKELINE
ncbi:ParA family protein [Aureibacter tunicatorum]|uniref:Chromosome partitioning protein n=1 Tax=Aureibacter tunicatorum TaxID=866807 RepID=A0AAE4BUD4_9BACT|nr:ParA family protein [Aureibacter tunicatorum]MDR6241676.1 chromosome partitioning protein [Aureibacter tunicatorum]BDD07338.1 hypothetical protein AUTU_48210 [Aureibacter tunicatorum]